MCTGAKSVAGKKCSKCLGSGVDLHTWCHDRFSQYQHDFIKNTLRRASHRWPWRNLAVQRARVGWGVFKCELCRGLITPGEKKLDHVNPVVDTGSGFQDFDVYAKRLFVRELGWQSICVWCHDEKTGKERDERTKARSGRNKARRSKKSA